MTLFRCCAGRNTDADVGDLIGLACAARLGSGALKRPGQLWVLLVSNASSLLYLSATRGRGQGPVLGAAALIVAANGPILMDNLLFVKQPQSLLVKDRLMLMLASLHTNADIEINTLNYSKLLWFMQHLS